MPCGMLGAATTPRLRLPRLSAAEALLLQAGRRTTKGMAIPIPKVVLLPAPIFSLFKTRKRACVSFITFTATKHTSAFSPAPIWKTEGPPNLYRFSGKFNTCHCHSHALPSKCRHYITLHTGIAVPLHITYLIHIYKFVIHIYKFVIHIYKFLLYIYKLFRHNIYLFLIHTVFTYFFI